MRNFIAVSFVTLLLVLGSSQDPRTRFTPLNLSPMDWDPSTALPPTECECVTSEQVAICSVLAGETEGDQGTITKNLVSGQCLNVTSPNHPGNFPNSGSSPYTCTMTITIPTSKRLNLRLLKDSFEFEAAVGIRCIYDYLELENILTADDDDDVDRTNANDRFCGTLTNDKALVSESEVPSVTLKFRADDNVSGKGFLATLCVP